MFWKRFVFVFLAVGALAEYQVTEEQTQQVRAMLTQYCKKNGAEDKAPDVENAIKTFINCTTTLINLEQIKKEIEEAKPNGALDEVFQKYCAKTPQLKSCIQSLLTGVSPCIDVGLRAHIDDFNNATSQLLDFVCYKDGDRIALFIAEGGPECFQEKSNALRECGTSARGNITTTTAAQELTLEEQCAKFDNLAQCVVTALEGCSTPTPGNMAEALFKFIRKGSPCKDIKVHTKGH